VGGGGRGYKISENFDQNQKKPKYLERARKKRKKINRGVKNKEKVRKKTLEDDRKTGFFN